MKLVFLVDDDPAVTRLLGRVLREEGWEVETFDSAEAFLVRSKPERYGCLVLDMSMPGLDGLGLQRRLRETGQSLPIVFLTGAGDVRMSVQAIKAGAADFLTKPVASVALAHAVRTAFDKDAADRVARAERAMLEWHLAMLTARDREELVAVASEGSTSRSRATSASSSRPSSSIARASWNACRRARPPS
jgi:FixJ family two-component response regulator